MNKPTEATHSYTVINQLDRIFISRAAAAAAAATLFFLSILASRSPATTLSTDLSLRSLVYAVSLFILSVVLRNKTKP